MYWSHAVPAAAHRRHAANYSGPWPPTEWSVFSKQADSDIYQKKDAYVAAYNAFLNWVRLSAVMALYSYLETYLHVVTTMAMESDPGLLIGAPQAVDGVQLLKRQAKYSRSEEASGFSAGTWAERVAQFREKFAFGRDAFAAYVIELDAMRRMRHNVAHSFGRDLHLRGREGMTPLPMASVSEKRLTKWLGISVEVAQIVEEKVRPHVGAYELLRYYHRRKASAGAAAVNSVKVLKSEIGKEFGTAPGNVYIAGMMSAYREA